VCYGFFALGVVSGFGLFCAIWLWSWASKDKCPVCGGCGNVGYEYGILVRVALENSGWSMWKKESTTEEEENV